MTVANPVHAVDVQLLEIQVLEFEVDAFLDKLPHWFYLNHSHYSEADDCVQSIGNLTHDLINTNERYPLFGKVISLIVQQLHQ